MLSIKDVIVPHHAADSSIGKQYGKTYAYHDNGAPRADGTLKWDPGKGIQYHFFIERDGELISERNEQDILWHAGKWNYRSIGICFAGNFVNEVPTLAQIETYFKLVDGLIRKHDIKFIYNHHEIRPTACPALDLRKVYEDEKRRRRLIITGSTIRRRIRKFKRLMRDADGNVRSMYERRIERMRVCLDRSIFDNRDCCE